MRITMTLPALTSAGPDTNSGRRRRRRVRRRRFRRRSNTYT
jgi:hypothetical protein